MFMHFNLVDNIRNSFFCHCISLFIETDFIARKYKILAITNQINTFVTGININYITTVNYLAI